MIPAVVDISSNFVRTVELKKHVHKVDLGYYGEYPISQSDDVLSNSDLKVTLQDLKKKYHWKFISVSLPDSKAYLFRISLPYLSPKELRGAIELQLEENVPLPLAESVFDYTVISHDPKINKMEISVAVFPKNLLNGYIQLLKDVDLIPESFYLTAGAVARCVIKEEDMRTCMIVNIDEQNTGVYIVSDGVVQFTSNLNFGAATLTLAIQKQFSLTPEKAEEFKKDKDFMKNKENMEMFFSLINPLSSLRDEVSRLSNYWNNYKDKNGHVGKKVERIILCGGDASLTGLDEYLSQSLKIETVVGNVWTNVLSLNETIPTLSFDDSLRYAAAIGLAVEARNYHT
jgi:type IV pilus assembly protein PilM